MMGEKKEVNKFSFGKIISWALFVIFGLVALGAFASASAFQGIIVLLVALLWLPFTSNFIKNKVGKNLNIWAKIGITVILLIIVGATLPSKSESTNSISKLGNIVNKEELSQQSAQNQEIQNQDIKSFLPTRSEIPTEFRLGAAKNYTINFSGFTKGVHLDAVKIEGSSGAIVLDFYVFEFISSQHAKQNYDWHVNTILQEGGYSEINANAKSSCFLFKQDYGYQARFGNAYCQNGRYEFEIIVTTTNTFKQPDNYLKDMLKVMDSKFS